MKARQISKVIGEKVAELAKAHPEISGVLLKNSIVTGGCIASMLLKEKVNDFDIYFNDLNSMLDVIQYFGMKTGAEYLVAFQANKPLPKNGRIRPLYAGRRDYEVEDELTVALPTSDERVWYALYSDLSSLHDCDQIHYVSLYYKSSGYWAADEEKEEDAKEKYRVRFASSNAVTLSDKVQLVFRFFGPPDEIHKNYDFVHATNYWTSKTGLVTNTKALEAVLARELIYQGSRFPLASIFRTRKFIHRGWSMHIGYYVKMAFQLNEYDLKDLNTLREQLTGVDAAYLNGIIAAAERHPEAITCSWVCELVDAIIHSGNFDADENEDREMGAEHEDDET